MGTDRIGLDRSPAGVVSEADEAHAKAKLAVLGARRAGDAEANSLPESVRAGTVAPRVRVLSPYRVAETRLSIGKQSGVFAPARKSEPAASGRVGLAGLRVAALGRKAAGGNAKFE
jgi:hypothetical protein